MFKNKNFSEIDEALKLLVQESIKKLPVESATYELLSHELKIGLLVSQTGKEVETSAKLRIEKALCKFCKARKGGYWEALLQVRNLPSRAYDETLTMLEKLKEKNRFCFISQQKEVQNGFDLYLGSKSAAHVLAHFLAKKFKSEVRIKKKLHTHKGRRKIYKEIVRVG